MQSLVDLVYNPLSEWQSTARQAFIDALPARYQRVTAADLDEGSATTNNRFQLRVNASTGERDVPFVALIAPRQERSGPYGGMSFVMFPSKEEGKPALMSRDVQFPALAGHPLSRTLGGSSVGRLGFHLSEPEASAVDVHHVAVVQ